MTDYLNNISAKLEIIKANHDQQSAGANRR